MKCMEALGIERWEAHGQFNKISLAYNPIQKIINIFMLRTVMTMLMSTLMMLGKPLEIIANQILTEL